jgi:pyruvate/2-oxoglutarate dehydrogenase complex dihydrolipoamide dehydrogenase (E3) component
MSRFDAIIIGAGQAGPSLAGRPLLLGGRPMSRVSRAIRSYAP